MKGTNFQQGLEFKVEIKGEKWRQGDHISGLLTIIEHKKHPFSADQLGVALAIGDKKKLRSKDPDAFTIVQSQTLNNLNQNQMEWSFKLENHSQISDKTATPYLLYGPLDDLTLTDNLELLVEPTPLISEFLQIYDHFYRFPCKEIKSKDEFLEAKLVAPSSQEFASVDGIDLLIKIENDVMYLNYTFKVTQLTYSPQGVKSSKKKVRMKFELTKKQYCLHGDAPNQQVIREHIDQTLEKIKTKTMI